MARVVSMSTMAIMCLKLMWKSYKISGGLQVLTFLVSNEFSQMSKVNFVDLFCNILRKIIDNILVIKELPEIRFLQE